MYSNMYSSSTHIMALPNTTEEVYEVETIAGVFGHVEVRFMFVKWTGYDEPEYEREHLLGCHSLIRRLRIAIPVEFQ